MLTVPGTARIFFGGKITAMKVPRTKPNKSQRHINEVVPEHRSAFVDPGTNTHKESPRGSSLVVQCIKDPVLSLLWLWLLLWYRFDP